jgi:hypothetical protein
MAVFINMEKINMNRKEILNLIDKINSPKPIIIKKIAGPFDQEDYSIIPKKNEPILSPMDPSDYSTPKRPSYSIDIKRMQFSMQTLASTVMRDSEASVMSFKVKDNKEKIGNQSQIASKKAFNDFFTENYMATLPDEAKGVEWSPDLSKKTYQQKKPTQTDLYELNNVMQTMKRIGGAYAEFIPDGRWSYRTDNGLRNMYSFAYGLLQLEGDFGIPNNQIFTSKDLSSFKNTLDYQVEDDVVKLTESEKSKRAKILTVLLNKVQKLYVYFQEHVIGDADHRRYIEGDLAFDSYENLTRDERSILAIPGEDLITEPYSGNKLEYIPLSALKNKDSYLKWMKDKTNFNENEAFEFLTKNLKVQVDKVLMPKTVNS